MNVTDDELAAVRERHDAIPQDALPIDDDDPSTWDWPEPAQHVNYRGELGPQYGRVFGPLPLYGEDIFYTVVAQEYDGETDMTRLGLAYGIVSPAQPGGES